MPGGMGGGLMGMLMKGAMGGPGGGMMGGAPQNAAAAGAANGSDVYDVDRWKRADDVDAAPTTVQAVRSAWEREQVEREQRSLKYKLKNLLKKNTHKKDKKNKKQEAPQETRPVGGTVVMPEMKKASKRINSAVEKPEESSPVPTSEPCGQGKPGVNYLGLDVQTGIDEFFTENPLNSAILAVDSLSMGPLTLNQVKPAHRCSKSGRKTETAAPSVKPVQEAAPAAPHSGDAIARQEETSYMNDLHASREQRKYQVRIT